MAREFMDADATAAGCESRDLHWQARSRRSARRQMAGEMVQEILPHASPDAVDRGALGVMPRLLFITSTRIGDAVLSTAALEHARAMIGADRITIACGAPAAPLFRATPGVEAVHII